MYLEIAEHNSLKGILRKDSQIIINYYYTIIKRLPDRHKSSEQRIAVLTENRWLCPILYSGCKKSNFTEEHGAASVHCQNVILKP